jgi:hypothetical protein
MLLRSIPDSFDPQRGKSALSVIPDRDRIAPVKLLDRWLAAADIAEGPVFRKLAPQGRLTAKRMSDRGVAIVFQQRAAFRTEAGRQGAQVLSMKDHSRHRSLDMVSE